MKRLLFALCLAGALPAAPAAAQDAPADATDRKVAQMIGRAKKVYGVPDPAAKCRRNPDSDEIVVCVDRGEDLKVPPTSESDPTSRAALNDGLPRAPQLDRGSCRGQPGCMVGGYAPPPIYIVDVSKLPQAPEGSDADLIARGEMPAP